MSFFIEKTFFQEKKQIENSGFVKTCDEYVHSIVNWPIMLGQMNTDKPNE